MGINELTTKILRPYAKNGFVNKPISEFSGKRVAIDAHNLIYRIFAVVLKDEVAKTDIAKVDVNREVMVNKWILAIIDFGLRWLENGVTPVFIFDGQSRTEKGQTQNKRAQAKREAKEKANAAIEKVRSGDILSTSQEDIDTAKKYLRQTTTIYPLELSSLKKYLGSFGFPVLESQHDAEQMCAALAIEGKVEGVFTEDTDTLTFGCHLVITDFERTDELTTLNCVDLKCILEDLNMTFETFVDLCIMLGCDYNQRIYKIGPAKIMKLFTKYTNIDEIAEELDVTSLDHNKCRKIFEYLPSETKTKLLNMQIQNIKFTTDIFSVDESSNLMTSKDLKFRQDKLNFLLKQLPPPTSSKTVRNPYNLYMATDFILSL